MKGSVETKETINILKGFSKWMKGKGKKYLSNVNVDMGEVSDAIDKAVTHLQKRMDHDDFITMSGMVEEFVAITKSKKQHLMNNEKRALRSMRKVVKFIVKKNG